MKTLLLATTLATVAATGWAGSNYGIAVSEKTEAEPGWKQVVDSLKQKHSAGVFIYAVKPGEVLPRLREVLPRYLCFVARPEEAGREFVAQVHQLTRRLDDDPYTDCFWGIVTGYDADAALRIARCNEPLTVRKVASGTEIALDMCEEGFWYDELVKNKHVRKEKGGQARQLLGPDDTTELLVKSLTEYKADLFIASGHATERDWMIGYRYKNGFFRCANGELYGLDTQQRKYPIESPDPKVYLPVGNCLMGHVDGKDAMALAWMNSAGVRQMIG